jgi:hypothetical protein
MINSLSNIHFCNKSKTIISEHLKECSECRTALTIISEKVLTLPMIGMFLSNKDKESITNLFNTILKG